MSKSNPRTACEVTRLAQDRGFRFDRQNGSHATYKHGDGRQVTICQGHRGDIPNGTLRAILKVVLGLVIILALWNAIAPYSLQLVAWSAWHIVIG